MLILSRRFGEAVQIGDDITVTVLEIRGSAIRLGIDAPPDQRILRDELIELSDDEVPADADEALV